MDSNPHRMAQSPEEHSPGVLQRIGSWLSPWTGRNTRALSEDAAQPETVNPEQQSHSQGPEKGDGEERSGEESQDSLLLTQAGSAAGAESVVSTADRTGEQQTSLKTTGGNPSLDRNAKHLSNHTRGGETAAVRVPDSTQRRRGIQVYLEETSVSLTGNTDDSDPVVETTVKRSFQVYAKASSKRSALAESKGQKDDSKLIRPVQVTCHLSGQESEPDTMGRRNSGRRRSRKNSQGDGDRSQDKTPTKTQRGNPATSSHSPCVEAHLREESSENVTPEPSPTDNTAAPGSPEQCSPEETACAARAEPLEGNDPTDPQISPGVTVHATLISVSETDSDVDMDDGRVERRTETPESKRRSLKVSKSEKFFAKKVIVNPELSSQGEEASAADAETNRGDSKTTTTNPEPRGGNVRSGDVKTENNAQRLMQNKGRIADKISLFEQRVETGTTKAPSSVRNLDVSPARKVSERLKELGQNQGSKTGQAKSVEGRSSSAPPIRDSESQPQSVRERARNFIAASLEDVKVRQRLKSGADVHSKQAVTGQSKSAKSNAASKQGKDQIKSVKTSDEDKTVSSRNTKKTVSELELQESSSLTAKPVHAVDQTDFKTQNARKEREIPPEPQVTNTQSSAKEEEKPGHGEKVSVSSESTDTQITKLPQRSASKSKKRRSKEGTQRSSDAGADKTETAHSKQEDDLTSLKNASGPTSDLSGKTGSVSQASDDKDSSKSVKKSDAKEEPPFKCSQENESNLANVQPTQGKDVVSVDETDKLQPTCPDGGSVEGTPEETGTENVRKAENTEEKRENTNQQAKKKNKDSTTKRPERIPKTLPSQSDSSTDSGSLTQKRPEKVQERQSDKSSDVTAPPEKNKSEGSFKETDKHAPSWKTTVKKEGEEKVKENNGGDECSSLTGQPVIQTPSARAEPSPKKHTETAAPVPNMSTDSAQDVSQKEDKQTLEDTDGTKDTPKTSKGVIVQEDTSRKDSDAVERQTVDESSNVEKSAQASSGEQSSGVTFAVGKKNQVTEKAQLQSRAGTTEKGSTEPLSLDAEPGPGRTKEPSVSGVTLENVSGKVSVSSQSSSKSQAPPHSTSLSHELDMSSSKRQKTPNADSSTGQKLETHTTASETLPRASSKGSEGQNLELQKEHDPAPPALLDTGKEVQNQEQCPISVQSENKEGDNRTKIQRQETERKGASETATANIVSEGQKTAEIMTGADTHTHSEIKPALNGQSSSEADSQSENQKTSLLPEHSPAASTKESALPNSTEEKSSVSSSVNDEKSVPSSANEKSAASPNSDNGKVSLRHSADEKPSPARLTKTNNTSANQKPSPHPFSDAANKSIPPSSFIKEKSSSSSPDSTKSSSPKVSPNAKSPSLLIPAKTTPKTPPSPDAVTRRKDIGSNRILLPEVPLPPGRPSLDGASPSSWLDVDLSRSPKQKPQIQAPKLTSSVSESNLLDVSGEFDPDDFINNIKKYSSPFTLPLRKHSFLKSQAPPFALPAIQEDRFEKVFDPAEFQIGLRKRRDFSSSLSLLSRQNDSENTGDAPEGKPKRKGVERKSILCRSLLLRGNEGGQEEEDEKEEATREERAEDLKPDQLKVKSRLERSAILSSLRSPRSGKRMEFSFQPEVSADGPQSPHMAMEPHTPLETQEAQSSKETVSGLHRSSQLDSTKSEASLDTATHAQKTSQSDQRSAKADNSTFPPSHTTSPDDHHIGHTNPSTPSGDLSKVLSKQPAAPDHFSVPPNDSTAPGPQSKAPPKHSNAPADQSKVPLGHSTTPVDQSKVPLDHSTVSADKLKALSNHSSAPRDQPKVPPDHSTVPVDSSVNRATGANGSPPGPRFDDIQLPDYIGKLLEKKHGKADPPETHHSEVSRETAPALPGPAGSREDKKPPQSSANPDLTRAQAPQPGLPFTHKSRQTVRGYHRRPGKMVMFEHAQFKGKAYEVFRDVPDATSYTLSPLISVKVVRGCWILYEKPGFEGRCIPLEEGATDIPNEWADEVGLPPGADPLAPPTAPMVIGSIRLAVKDYRPPHIDLYTDPGGLGRMTSYYEDTEEIGSYSLPQTTGSIKVHCGVWMVYSEPGFQGLMAVLEAGEYPCPDAWGFPYPAVGSVRALRMGGLKVENPSEVKALLYERAGLEGRCVEVQGEVYSFGEEHSEEPNEGTHTLSSVGSMKIISGLWVGYEQPGFEGPHYILEEGEYLDWKDWGGDSENLWSIQPIVSDFLSPHMKMFSELDFGERGVNIDLLGPVPNLADTGYGLQSQSVEVLEGVWVAFEEAEFSGQMYVLEKGLYSCPEDWGGQNSKISSVMPVTMDNLGNPSKFKVRLFSEAGLTGASVLLEDELPIMPQGFTLGSCKVLAGSWVAFEGEEFTGRQCVLEEGEFPDLITMGFTQPHTAVLSLRPVGYEFSLPSIVLFERPAMRGRRVQLKTASVNLQITGDCTRVHSVMVEGGMWVLYEAINFRGSQILLRPGEVPDWPKFSGWSRIRSLRPLAQKQVQFCLRHNETGLLMSVSGPVNDVKLMRIQVMEETGGPEQVWSYRDGLLQCQMLEDCCVMPSGTVVMAGGRLTLSSEPGKAEQLWSLSADGIIRNNVAPHLVLEVKGGQQYDKHQVILNEFHPRKANQRWSVELL